MNISFSFSERILGPLRTACDKGYRWALEAYEKRDAQNWLKTAGKISLLVAKIFLGVLFLKGNAFLFVVSFAAGALF
ncbi:MAG: hypothetical protein K0S07_1192, partial [Chlamydiales bacterium]|nr:hypothetical protein [Chlamydiales bacterium]